MTMVTPLQILLFGAREVIATSPNTVVVDNWIAFKMDVQLAAAIVALYEPFNYLLHRVVEDPELLGELPENDMALINVVKRLCYFGSSGLDIPAGGVGFLSQNEVGDGPPPIKTARLSPAVAMGRIGFGNGYGNGRPGGYSGSINGNNNMGNRFGSSGGFRGGGFQGHNKRGGFQGNTKDGASGFGGRGGGGFRGNNRGGFVGGFRLGGFASGSGNLGGGGFRGGYGKSRGSFLNSFSSSRDNF